MSDIFQSHGHFESLQDPVTLKCIGTRHCELEAGRQLGAAGQRVVTISESFDYDKGHRKARFTIKRGESRQFFSTVYTICGRMLSKV